MASRTLGLCLYMYMYYSFMCTLQVASQPYLQIHVGDGGTLDDLDGIEEGENVTLRCEARGLSLEYFVIWQHDVEVLHTSGRITVDSVPLPSRGDTIRGEKLTLTISSILGTDRGVYRCRVAQHNQASGQDFVIASSEVTLTVFSFPDDLDPVCSPAGPLTVFSGDSVSLNCSTSKGYPPVYVNISSPYATEWSYEQTEVDWVATLGQDGAVFRCDVSSSHYPNRLKSCVIGPIHVVERPTTILYDDSPTLSDSPTPVPSHMPGGPLMGPGDSAPTAPSSVPPPNPCLPWFVTFIVCASLLPISLVLNILMCAVTMRMRSSRISDRHIQAEEAFVEKKSRNKLNLQLNGIRNNIFIVEPLSDISGTSPI